MDDMKLLKEADAALFLGVSVKTLRNWRCSKMRPLKWIKLGHAVRYRQADLLQFIEDNVRV